MEEKLESIINNLKCDIICGIMPATKISYNNNFNPTKSEPKKEKYIIGNIGDITVTIDPNMESTDLRILNSQGKLVIDLAEEGFTMMDLV